MMNGYIKIITAMTLWGSVGLFVLWSSLDSTTISFFRCIIGCSVLFIFTRNITFSYFKKYSFNDYFLMMTGGIFLVLNWMFLFKSFQLASITIGNISYYTQPIFLVLLGIFFLHEKVSLLKWSFIFLTFLGIVLTVNIHIKEINLNNTTLIGTLYAFIAGLLYAFATIIVKKQKHIDAKHITFIQLLTGFIILLPFIHLNFLPKNHLQWEYILILGVVHTAIAYLLYYSAVRHVNVTAIAVLSYIDPIIAILTDIIFFHRHLTMTQWLGIALTLIASYRVITLKDHYQHNSLLLEKA